MSFNCNSQHGITVLSAPAADAAHSDRKYSQKEEVPEEIHHWGRVKGNNVTCVFRVLLYLKLPPYQVFFK